MMVVANFIFHRCPQQSLLRNMLFLWNVMWHSPQEAESPFFPMESGLAYDSRPVVSEARSWKVPPGSLGSLAPGTQSLCCEEAPADTRKGPRRCSRGRPAEVPAAARPASAVSKWGSGRLQSPGTHPFSLQAFLAEKNCCALSEFLTHKLCDHKRITLVVLCH